MDHIEVICLVLRNFHTIVHSGQHYVSNDSVVRVPFSHILVNTCVLSCALTVAILIGVRRYLIAVLIRISLVISDVEHLFMCLLATCMSSLKNAFGDLTLKSSIYFESVYMV